MTVRSAEAESSVAAQVAMAVKEMEAVDPAAVGLLNVLAFLGAEDIPRRMLRTEDGQLDRDVGGWANDRAVLMTALSTLVEKALIKFDGSGVFIHRNRQEAVAQLLEPAARKHFARSAALLVHEAMPDARLVDQWSWGARTVRHAIVAAGHLETLSVEQHLTARLRLAVARFQMMQGQLEGARVSLQRAQSLVEQIEPGGRLEATIWNDLADTHRRLGEFTRALEFAQRAHDRHRRLAVTASFGQKPVDPAKSQMEAGAETLTPHTTPDADVAADLRTRGVIEQDRGNLGDALHLLEESLQMFQTTLGVEDINTLEVLENLFAVLLEAGDLHRASRFLQYSIDIKSRLRGFGDDVEDSRLLLDILRGEVPAAEGSKQLSERFHRRYGAHHQFTADGLRLLGATLTVSGRTDEARTALQTALNVDETNLGPHHYRVAQSRVALMRLNLHVLDLAAAMNEAIQALDIVRRTPALDRPAVFRLIGIADAVADVGDVAEQRPFLDLLESHLLHGAGDPETVMEMNGAVSRALTRSGDRALLASDIDAALAEYERALGFARTTTDTHLDDFDAEVRIGFLAALRGDAPLAREHWRSALDLFKDDALAAWSLWFLVRMYGQLASKGGHSPAARDVLDQLLEDAEKEGKVTRFRGSISSLVPEGWFVKESITLLAADGKANVIASAEPLDPSTDTSQYAGIQGDRLRKEFPGYTEHWVEERDVLGGRPGVMRSFSWAPPDGEPVTQVQLYYAMNGRGYTATATTPADNYPALDHLLLTALQSLRIEGE